MPRGGVGGVPLGTELSAGSLGWESPAQELPLPSGWRAHELSPPQGMGGTSSSLCHHLRVPLAGAASRSALPPAWGSCCCSLNPKAALASSRLLSLPGCAFSLSTWRSRAAEPHPAPLSPPDPLLALGSRQPGLGCLQLLLFILLIVPLSKTWARQTLLSSLPVPVPVSTSGGFPRVTLTMVVATLGAHLPRRAPCLGSGCAAVS